MKQYEVEVMEKYSHGQHGKQRFMGWILSHTSKDGAIDFAKDIMSGMTWGDFKKESVRPLSIFMHMSLYGFKEDDPISIEHIEKHFSFRATLMKKGIDYEE